MIINRNKLTNKMQRMMETRLAQMQATHNPVGDAVNDFAETIGEWFERQGEKIEDNVLEPIADWVVRFGTETLPSWDAAAENWLENATQTRQEWAAAA